MSFMIGLIVGGCLGFLLAEMFVIFMIEDRKEDK